MVLTASTMLELGAAAPQFSLPDVGGKVVGLADVKGPSGLLVIFMCNHCPYVKHIQQELVAIGREYGDKGIGMVGINANDAVAHPDDSFEKMKEEAQRLGYPFPYLYDESQEVAKAYHAACTPDFFLFDAGDKLVYRGQLDDSRPGNDVPVTGRDLRQAMDTLLAGEAIVEDQQPSMGCNIKWKPGKAPDYFSVT